MAAPDDARSVTACFDEAGDEDMGEENRHMTSAAAVESLSVIRVSDGEGQFQLSTPWTGTGREVAVDITPGHLRLRSGRISRWVPLPDDVLVDQAVIRHSAEWLTVTIPEKERRQRRDLIHVW